MLMNVIKCLPFAFLAALVVAVWVAAYKSVFPISPVLYSVSGWLSI